MAISSSTLDFLTDLGQNNHRDWFAGQKPRFEAAKIDVKAFGEELLEKIRLHDNIEKIKYYRIYRDVRFSKDKTPYKKSLSISLTRATKWLRGGMYFHIEPGNTFAAGGFWNPNSADLSRIRKEIAIDADSLRTIITEEKFVEYFGQLNGNQVKTAPKGYSRTHPNIDLLRYKQFLVEHHFTDEQVLSPNFVDEVVTTFLAMRPFFDYMSDVLTTDENGVPIE